MVVVSSRLGRLAPLRLSTGFLFTHGQVTTLRPALFPLHVEGLPVFGGVVVAAAAAFSDPPESLSVPVVVR